MGDKHRRTCRGEHVRRRVSIDNFS
jgi:hypothetical protein